ncbi:uncharacterized protein AMSG_05153 [Thecamonas trahens ATCC 50062]|uniref:Uncharacterized protein n=1 Tax=Thecamonas trahens ATCC 50062 TaxID=461836 RepID=A0A0L0DA02_THETB|nr:hypothetical protein AMSG_05153 [Thecamonas trahens ATCC 50062]KNC49174.1 hypothetical protein AMSG_05153 [Thecamonas trahens ATCC 50062]|eukprot:XP_013758194.1 hypothetical protein AMSG_05153 [Thecamonas trahens ATCC 50062]
MLAGKLVRRKKIHNFLTLSRPADVFNSVMLNFPVVGVVNDNHRTVRACHSSGSAPYGTSRTSPMLPASAGNLEVQHHRVGHFETRDNASERPSR